MRRFITSTLLALAITMILASVTLAVPFHQHVLITPSGQAVDIASGVCLNDLQGALDNLHEHVHTGAAGSAFAGNPITLQVTACP